MTNPDSFLSWLAILLVIALIFVSLAKWFLTARVGPTGKTNHQEDEKLLSLKGVKFDIPTKPPLLRDPRFRRRLVRRNTAVLTSPTPVDFDPRDRDHLIALYLMMVEKRLHPEVRFRFNPAEFDNAYIACLFQLADHHITKDVKDAACVLSDSLTEKAAARLILVGDVAFSWEIATEAQAQVHVNPGTGGINIPVELHPSAVL